MIVQVFFITLFFLVLPAPSSYGQANKHIPREYEVKAIYLYNFLQFVHWPIQKCIDADEGKIREIAVIGDSPIGSSLQALKAELMRTQNTEISVRFYGPYHEGLDLSGCRLLFITQSEKNNVKKILESVKDEAVLTVADTEECLEQGCMIALISRMNKVRWAVNRDTAEKAGLRLSARLLSMAVKVIDTK